MNFSEPESPQKPAPGLQMEGRTTPGRPRAVLWMLTVLVVVAAGAIALLEGQSQPPRLPVEWTPKALEITVLSGTVEGATFSFRVPDTLQDASLFVTPEIATLFRIADAEGSGTVQPDRTYTLNASIEAPLSISAGSYEGVVHLRYGNATAARPLPVVINVVPPTAEAIPVTASTPSIDRIITTPEGRVLVKDELIIILSREISDPDRRIREIAQVSGGVITGSLPGTWSYEIRYDVESIAHLESIRGMLLTLADVEAVLMSIVAQPLTNADHTTPSEWNDPDWNHWNLEYIEAPLAWNIETGKRDVVVGVIDKVFYEDHEDLRGNVLPPVLGVRSSFGLLGGHGTHVTGIIAADGNNGVGVAGVAWSATLRLYDVSTLKAYQVADVMLKAAHEGARIINMSIGFTDHLSDTVARKDALEAAKTLGIALQAAIDDPDVDVLWVFAAGNKNRDAELESPANLAKYFPDNVLTVANVGQSGTLYKTSNWGPVVSVAAPGESIRSTTRKLVCGIFSDDCSDYAEMTGTSQAAPQVAGLAALILSRHRSLAASKVKQCIVEASKRDGPEFPGHSFSGLNAFSAVKCTFANDDAYTMTQGTALTVFAPGVLEHDIVPPDLNARVEFISPLNPDVLINLDGNGGFTLDMTGPRAGFVGTVAFDYVIVTDKWTSDRATVRVIVEPGATAPAPHIEQIAPSSVVGSVFDLTINGTGFDPVGAVDQVYLPDGTLMGQGVIKSRSATQIVVTQHMAGAAPLLQPYIVKVRNSDGQLSNGVPLTLTNEVSVSPATGLPGTQFNYTGRGFTADQTATSHLKRPDGTEFPSLVIPIAADGTFSRVIDSTGFTPGQYEVRAVDDSTVRESPHVTFVVSDGAQTSSWSTYQHDASRSGRSGHLGPDLLTEAWSIALTNASSSAAVGPDSRLWQTVAGPNRSFRLQAFWPSGVMAVDNGPFGQDPGPISFRQDGGLYVAARARIYSFTSEGDLEWFVDTVDPGPTSPAVRADGSFVVSINPVQFCQVEVASFDKNGNRLWQTPFGCNGLTTVALTPDGDAIVAHPADFGGMVYRLDGITGDIEWSRASTRPGPPSVSESGRIFFLEATSRLVALNPDGSTAWQSDVLGVSPLRPPVSIHDDDGVSVVTTDANAGSMATLRRFLPDGTPSWTQTLVPVTSGSPIALIDGAGRVFVSLERNTVADPPVSLIYAFDSSGQQLWQQDAQHVFWTVIGGESTLYATILDALGLRLIALRD
jgi:subtilisin family serine protease